MGMEAMTMRILRKMIIELRAGEKGEQVSKMNSYEGVREVVC